MKSAAVLYAAFGLAMATAAPIRSGAGEEIWDGECSVVTSLDVDEGFCSTPATQYSRALVDDTVDLFPAGDWGAATSPPRGDRVAEPATLITAAIGVALSLIGLNGRAAKRKHRPGCHRVRKDIRLMA